MPSLLTVQHKASSNGAITNFPVLMKLHMTHQLPNIYKAICFGSQLAQRNLHRLNGSAM